jgi:hypothetical protein
MIFMSNWLTIVIMSDSSSVGSSLNVFFSDPVLINQFIYERWLSGLNAESTARELRNKQTQNVGDERYFYLIQNETVYQYRIFDQIVKLLAGNIYLFSKIHKRLRS